MSIYELLGLISSKIENIESRNEQITENINLLKEKNIINETLDEINLDSIISLDDQEERIYEFLFDNSFYQELKESFIKYRAIKTLAYPITLKLPQVKQFFEQIENIINTSKTKINNLVNENNDQILNELNILKRIYENDDTLELELISGEKLLSYINTLELDEVNKTQALLYAVEASSRILERKVREREERILSQIDENDIEITEERAEEQARIDTISSEWYNKIKNILYNSDEASRLTNIGASIYYPITTDGIKGLLITRGITSPDEITEELVIDVIKKVIKEELVNNYIDEKEELFNKIIKLFSIENPDSFKELIISRINLDEINDNHIEIIDSLIETICKEKLKEAGEKINIFFEFISLVNSDSMNEAKEKFLQIDNIILSNEDIIKIKEDISSSDIDEDSIIECLNYLNENFNIFMSENFTTNDEYSIKAKVEEIYPLIGNLLETGKFRENSLSNDGIDINSLVVLIGLFLDETSNFTRISNEYFRTNSNPIEGVVFENLLFTEEFVECVEALTDSDSINETKKKLKDINEKGYLPPVSIKYNYDRENTGIMKVNPVWEFKPHSTRGFLEAIEGRNNESMKCVLFYVSHIIKRNGNDIKNSELAANIYRRDKEIIKELADKCKGTRDQYLSTKLSEVQLDFEKRIKRKLKIKELN